MKNFAVSDKPQLNRGCAIAAIVEKDRVTPFALHPDAHEALARGHSRVVGFELSETVEPDARVAVSGFDIYRVF
ncbi:MAG: hypothetical protein P8X98_12440 [Woeseiaceae bacterium]